MERPQRHHRSRGNADPEEGESVGGQVNDNAAGGKGACVCDADGGQRLVASGQLLVDAGREGLHDREGRHDIDTCDGQFFRYLKINSLIQFKKKNFLHI